MTRDQLDGPPWGTNVDPDEAYLRGQAGSAGSGLLGGLSQAWYGGALEAPREPQDEVREAVAELARESADPRERLPSPDEPGKGRR